MSIDCFQGDRFLERVSVRCPLEHYRFCRSLLLQAPSREKIEQALRYPFARNYQPSIAAAALLSRAIGLAYPPVIPRLMPSGAPCAMTKDAKREDCLLPIPIAEELAVLWQKLGFSEGETAEIWARQFRGSSRQLYTRENSFLAEEANSRGEQGISVDSYLGLASFVTREIDASLTLTGFNSALGAIRMGDVSIPAFGPQVAPLSEAGGFGISQLLAHGSSIFTQPDHLEMEGWTRCHGSKETWLHLNAKLAERSASLSFRLSSSESLIRISFYVQADQCQLGTETFEPGSLRRYQGKAGPILLNGRIRLESNRQDQELQIIPLAGKDCFWNANFLIAYTCPPSEQISFQFST